MQSIADSVFAAVEHIFTAVQSFVWGVPMVLALFAAGLYLTVGGGFVQFRHFPLICRKTAGSLFARPARDESRPAQGLSREKKISPFRAMSAALAGTLGTGNILGVATAIALGGPGAVFWMWLSAALGMMTKFAEVALAVHYRVPDGKGGWLGGPMFTIRRGLPDAFAPLAGVFAVCCALASFGIGNMAQSGALSSQLDAAFGAPKWACGAVTAVVVLAIILGGIHRISGFTQIFVPVLTVAYMLFGVAAILLSIDKLPAALRDIFAGAFGLKAAAGGGIGYTLAQAMRFGVARGVFTNEAGMGSAPIAHASADTDSAVEQGFWGAFEVFLDTLVICTITALVILTSRAYSPAAPPQGMTADAFAGIFGDAGRSFVALAVAFFAVLTIVSWSHYACSCLTFLFPRNASRAVFVYRVLYGGAVYVGAVARFDFVWTVSDAFNGLMAIPNLISVLLLSRVVFRLLREYKTRE